MVCTMNFGVCRVIIVAEGQAGATLSFFHGGGLVDRALRLHVQPDYCSFKLRCS